jgi:hypothetical protein
MTAQQNVNHAQGIGFQVWSQAMKPCFTPLFVLSGEEIHQRA